jgi:hypothetical protein
MTICLICNIDIRDMSYLKIRIGLVDTSKKVI